MVVGPQSSYVEDGQSWSSLIYDRLSSMELSVEQFADDLGIHFTELYAAIERPQTVPLFQLYQIANQLNIDPCLLAESLLTAHSENQVVQPNIGKIKV